MKQFISSDALEAKLAHIFASPKTSGELSLIVARPATNERKILAEADLCVEQGLKGDNWKARGYKKMPNNEAHPDMQINIMASRVIEAIAGDKTQWPMAGDQLYIDMDLSEDNLPPGSKLSIGDAVLEITPEPHLGYRKFQERYGKDAVAFVNSSLGKQHHFRGLNAKVVQAGHIKAGDAVVKLG